MSSEEIGQADIDLLGAVRKAHGIGHSGFTGTVTTEGSVAVGTMSGTFRTVWDVESGGHCSELDLGAFSQRSGSDGTVLWNVDSLGKVIVRSSPDAVREADVQLRLRHFEFLFEPHGYRIAVRDESDGPVLIVTRIDAAELPYGTQEFRVDPVSMRIREQRGVDQGKALARRFGEYVEIDGMRFPREVIEVDDAGNETVYRVTSVATDVDVDPTAFAIPDDDAADFRFADGGTSAVIPIEIPDRHIYLAVEIGGMEATFILDTGAERTVISAELVDRLGLGRLGTAMAQGISGPQEYSIVAVQELRIGGVSLIDQKVISMDISAIAEALPGVDGFLGLEFFDRFVVAIDYVRMNVTVHDRSTFTYDGPGCAIKLDGRKCPITVNGHTGWFTIDTGSPMLDLYGWFAARHGFLADKASLRSTKGIAGMGSTEIEFFLGEADIVEVGSCTLRNVPIRMTETTEGVFANTAIAGNAGSVIWRRFVTYFDFAGERVIVEENREDVDAANEPHLWKLEDE